MDVSTHEVLAHLSIGLYGALVNLLLILEFEGLLVIIARVLAFLLEVLV